MTDKSVGELEREDREWRMRRAAELREKGLPVWAIAERLGATYEQASKWAQRGRSL